MKANNVGFDGSIQIFNGENCKIVFASSTKDSKGPETWHTSVNDNINGTVKNTFIWWDNSVDPELYYRNHEGRLFKINFEPVETNI